MAGAAASVALQRWTGDEMPFDALTPRFPLTGSVVRPEESKPKVNSSDLRIAALSMAQGQRYVHLRLLSAMSIVRIRIYSRGMGNVWVRLLSWRPAFPATSEAMMRMLVGMMACMLAVGCATTGYQRAEKTVKSMQSMKAELAAGRDLVADTMSTLDELYTAQAADLRPLYEQFGKQLKMVEQQAELARKRADALQKNRDAYIGAWADELGQIGSPEIRTLSKERRAETIDNFGAIQSAATVAREAYTALLADLRSIHQLLGQDLTAQGVQASSPQFEQARADARILQQRIGELIQELDRVSGEMAPSTAS